MVGGRAAPPRPSAPPGCGTEGLLRWPHPVPCLAPPRAGTPHRRYEGVSPAGSHKPNTSVPQAYYNKVEGVRKITTETGAGQWGASLAFATSLFGLECEV